MSGSLSFAGQKQQEGPKTAADKEYTVKLLRSQVRHRGKDLLSKGWCASSLNPTLFSSEQPACPLVHWCSRDCRAFCVQLASVTWGVFEEHQ